MYTPDITTWMNPSIEYLFDEEIVEYDIQDAGFSLIQEFHLLPDSEIERISRIEKGIKRHIEIGNLQKDKSFSDKLLGAFAKARGLFMDANHITDTSIISVKKDAFFLIGDVSNREFGKIKFLPKNRYSSYIRFANVHNLEIYYSDRGMDFKQINEHCIKRHRIYMVEFLKEFIRRMENHDGSIKRFLMNFIMRYKSLEMEEAYYLEFNNKSVAIDPVFNYREILIPLVDIVQKE